MFLKNYTSNVPVMTTIGRIEAVLIRCGVTSIAKEYDSGHNVSALLFKMPLEPRATKYVFRLMRTRRSKLFGKITRRIIRSFGPTEKPLMTSSSKASAQHGKLLRTRLRLRCLAFTCGRQSRWKYSCAIFGTANRPCLSALQTDSSRVCY